MEGPTVDKFSAEHAVSLWWDDSKTGCRIKTKKAVSAQGIIQNKETDSDEESDTGFIQHYYLKIPKPFMNLLLAVHNAYKYLKTFHTVHHSQTFPGP